MAEKQKGGAKASPSESVQPTEVAARDQVSKTDPGKHAGSEDAGVGTDREAPEDTSPRTQARMHIGAGHVAAPIEAPDAANQHDPEEGHSRSSTNPVSALAGRQTYAGENHVDFVDEDGKPLSADDIFEAHEETQAFRVVKQGVYQIFNYNGSQQPMSRRLFYKGQRVDLATAARLADADRLGKAQRAQEDERVKAEAKAFHAQS